LEKGYNALNRRVISGTIMLRSILLLSVFLVFSDPAFGQSKTKEPMSWQDILNKAGPPVQSVPQEPTYVPEPGDELFGPNPPKFAPSTNPTPSIHDPQHQLLQQRGQLKVVNVKQNDVLYVRQLPSEDSKIVGMIPPEAIGIIDLGESNGQWILVRYDDAEGWVNIYFVAKGNAPGAELSSEFQGVWLSAASNDSQCTASDWSSNRTDGLMKVTSRSIEMWEAGCNILSVKSTQSSLRAAPKSVEIQSACAGEGMTWNSKEGWDVTVSDRRTTLTIRTLETSNVKDDSGKPMPSADLRPPPVSVYVQCK
jgi:hypothetical protein